MAFGLIFQFLRQYCWKSVWFGYSRDVHDITGGGIDQNRRDGSRGEEEQQEFRDKVTVAHYLAPSLWFAFAPKMWTRLSCIRSAGVLTVLPMTLAAREASKVLIA
ncbi:hypothetical protein SAMN05216404_101320 [Nitrosospira multiformis]|uniref:Uncharacterized protein n=1 Tax=Nitrosospira multiformis TaxID=1231 RepID=A0A1H8BQD7_9PROT|nr:hypothetical protein SAMN05216404_101320 [Nitrosospira multiformis]